MLGVPKGILAGWGDIGEGKLEDGGAARGNEAWQAMAGEAEACRMLQAWLEERPSLSRQLVP